MGFTFDATLKDMGRESHQAFLAAFDRPPTSPVNLLNVDLSTVTMAADLVLGIGDPLGEIVHLDFQSSAAAWKHNDLLAYNALLHLHHRVPVHTVLILLRPQAAHSHVTGKVAYDSRPGRGKMEFWYEIVRLWERPAEQFLTGDLGITPLAVLGRLPAGLLPEDGLAIIAQRIVERLTSDAPAERAKKLLTDALLLAGLRVSRNVALNIFRGVRMLEESDTYLMILEQGEERGRRADIVLVGEARFGASTDAVRAQLDAVTDLARLKRMVSRAATAASWDEVLDTP